MDEHKITIESRDIPPLKAKILQYALDKLTTYELETLSVTTSTTTDDLKAQIEKNLTGWVNHLFRLASKSLLITDSTPVYAPIDEQLRLQVDALEQAATEEMVRVTKLRKQIPLQINEWVRGSLEILTSLTENALVVDVQHLEHTVQHSESLDPQVYAQMLQMYTLLKRDVPKVLLRQEETLDLFESLNIPLKDPANNEQLKRRRSSMMQQLSQQVEMSPKRARQRLVDSLQKEVGLKKL